MIPNGTLNDPKIAKKKNQNNERKNIADTSYCCQNQQKQNEKETTKKNFPLESTLKPVSPDKENPNSKRKLQKEKKTTFIYF